MADIEAAIQQITADIRTIVRGEIELAKAEVVPGAKKAGLGAGLLAGAGVVALLAVNVLFVSLGFAFTHLFWGNFGPIAAFALGFLCAAGVYLVLAAILALIGIANVKKLKTPQAAIAEGEKAVDVLSNAVGSGLAKVRLIASRGKKVITQDAATGQIVTVYSGPRRLADSGDDA
jgi:hypothetical protein